MKNYFLTITLAILVSLGWTAINAVGAPITSVTLATFADPSLNSDNFLFQVDFTQMTLGGGWSDVHTGLVLEIPCAGYTLEAGNAFQDAWFEMSVVSITSVSAMYGETGAGVINFYENGTSQNPLVIINFVSGSVSRFGLGADEIFVADNVTISGSAIPDNIAEESFAFSFTNLAKLPGHTNWTDGFTSSAAFTSSAILTAPEIPEPATLGILGMGSLLLRRSNKWYR